MNEQMTLEQAVKAGEAGREEGIARADEHANEQWKQEALEMIRLTALFHQFFTSSLVWDRISAATHEPRAMGALMRRAEKHGWIEPTDQFLCSVRPSQHRRPLRVWRSKIYGGP